MVEISAYIPCFNNAETVGATVASLYAQTVPIAYVVVIDDGSFDTSADVAARAGARVIRHDRNLGRGAARASGMAACQTDFVLCCDATNVLPADFVARALAWFEDEQVTAVFGRIRNATTRNTVDRWRGRYLFREHEPMSASQSAPFITFGTLVRRAAVQEAGGYDPALGHSEDNDLGSRLAQRGSVVVFDPTLPVYAVGPNTLRQVLERYWRWSVGVSEQATVKSYVRQVWYAWRHMVINDLRSRDPGMALISSLAPHYCYWRTRIRLWAHTAQTGA